MKIIFQNEVKQEKKPEEIVNLILKNRRIEKIKDFLNPPSPLSFSLKSFGSSFESSFKKVVEILKEIKTKNEMIVVYTDYDADGITGGAILWETLYLLGFKVMPYVPDRKKEGYGFSKKGIDNVIEKFHPSLVISVDHGITKIKEVEYLKEKGIKVIITDHHLKGEKIPQAEAVFHIPSLSGAGVAYFFAKEIFDSFKKETTYHQVLVNYFASDYLVLATIGIIADLVPLLGACRSIVKYGLANFSKTRRLGIKHILKEAGIEGKKITPYEIGFIIAPRINAVGRLENALDALRLLCTKKEEKALHLATYVGKKNRERQDILKASVKQAEEMIKTKIDRGLPLSKIIVLKNDFWHEGIIGLIAAKITERFYRPTIVLTKTDGIYKGSARSIAGFHITDFLRQLRDFLVDVGGHEQASGLTIKEDKLEKFVKEVEKLAEEKIKEKDLDKKIYVDLKIPLSFVSLELAKELEKLFPFGIGNSQPVFYSRGKTISAQIFGKKNEHLKIFVSSNIYDSEGQMLDNHFEFIFFNQSSLLPKISRDQEIGVIYTLEVNRWGEKEKIKGRVIEIIR